MKKINWMIGALIFMAFPIAGLTQVTVKKDSSIVAPNKDSLGLMKVGDSVASNKKDTVVIVAKPDSQLVVQPKDCFQEWYEKMRSRGAKPVTDGVHPVVITLKSEAGAVCLMGKIEVAGGKMKPPLLVQLEDGEFKPINAIGKKLDPLFTTSVPEDQLYAVTDGMSVVFRTVAQEYGRIIFYTFANKSSKSNKAAPSPDELMKD